MWGCQAHLLHLLAAEILKERGREAMLNQVTAGACVLIWHWTPCSVLRSSQMDMEVEDGIEIDD